MLLMNQKLFTADSAWDGGFYELALEVGTCSDEQLEKALNALWAHPDLDGCYINRNHEPWDQPRMPPSFRDDRMHLLGIARLPNGSRVACGSCIIRDSSDDPDWLDFYLPMGALCSVYPAGPFPLGTEADWPGSWRFEVEDWLAEIGVCIAQSATFRLGLIGWETSGQTDADDIAVKGIPSQRYYGYLWPSGGTVEYYRRTEA